ncbi:hypothetical protein FQN54_006416 [Arachnomyces sp. PD_36]|nr:hypothetical protein FQN54_006416 [Arachnomyces sp. PD_36]
MAPSPTFSDSFWTPDYASGLTTLFTKLQQGVAENAQLLTLATLRADAEDLYSSRLSDIAPAVDRTSSAGFGRDDGASVRKAFEGVRGEMVEAARSHRKIGGNIRELVVVPFGRWCEAHRARVQGSQDELGGKVREYTKQGELVRRLRSGYFNKCRLVEDLEEEGKLAFQSPEREKVVGMGSPKTPPKIVLTEEENEEDEMEPVELGDQTYVVEEVKKILTHMLEMIPMGEVKVPILGTYLNTSTGVDVVEYLQKHMGASSVGYAEKIGQDLVDNGFLRLVGNVGSTFANSSRMNYQWRPKVFKITGIPEKKKPLMRVTSAGSDAGSISDSPTVNSVSELLAGWNPLNNPYPNETPSEKLHRESREADEKYKSAVKKLDSLRCALEEDIINHLRFMERCELDRLRAIKSVVLDFSGAISNVIPGLQSMVDNMMLYQETIRPEGDLRYLLENYRTGAFVPKVQPYENYYGSVEDQSFGVDLEARARADRKRVPIIVTSILTFLDNHYPDLEGDEARRAIWLHDVPLSSTHHLRNALNNGRAAPREVMERYEIPVVASVLKLYLLELPDSLVSSQVYEIIKTIYTTTASETNEASRIKVLQSTLGQLRLNNIATLDAITTHFTRLIDLTSADEPYISSLAQTLAPCVLRPRTESSLSMNERHAYRLLRDLFAHKDAIFGELKRQSTAAAAAVNSLGAGAGDARPRAISTDESNRRANMEARNRAIADRSRAASPAPRHRRDRSTGAGGSGSASGSAGSSESTRFPINVGSPTASARPPPRHSLGLEVPSTDATEPEPEHGAGAAEPLTIDTSAAAAATNGSSANDNENSTPTQQSTTTSNIANTISELEKRSSTPTATSTPTTTSLSRNSVGAGSAGSGGRFARKHVGSGSTSSKRGSVVLNTPTTTTTSGAGVTLEDKPMDD